jgi:protein involved in polysaccharide export with SLBB domain
LENPCFVVAISSFEPAMNIPTPVNYVLGPGDELVVDIWGATTNLHQLEVGPEGTVTIDNLGPVYVHGLTIEEADQAHHGKIEAAVPWTATGEASQNTFARVSLGRVRSIQVTVIGEVETPGTYTVSSLATVFNALYKAGGPNNIGSFRQVEVMSNNGLF